MKDTNEGRHQEDARIKELLGGIPLPEYAQPAPDRLEFLSRATVVSQRHNWLLTRTKRRYMLVAAVGAMIAILAFASNYWFIPLADWMTHPAWANVEAYMVEYECVYRRDETPGRTDDPHLTAATQIADLIAEEYEDLAPTANTPVLSFHSSQTRDLGWWRWRVYRFVALVDDAAMLAELGARLKGLNAFKGPRKTLVRFYYRDRFSAQPTRNEAFFMESRKLIIDGHEYDIPQDVQPGLLHRFHQDFESLEPGQVSIRAYWIPGQLYYSPKLNTMGVGQLVELEMNDEGDIIVTTLQEELDIEIPDELFDGLGQHVTLEQELGLDDGGVVTHHDSEFEARKAGCRPTIIVNLSESDYQDCDPVALLEEEAARQGELRRIAVEHPPRHECYFLTSVESDWQNAVESSASEEDSSRSRQLLETAQQATADFLRQHQECWIWPHTPPASVDQLGVTDGPVLVIGGSIYTQNAEVAREYEQALEHQLQLGAPLSRVLPASEPLDSKAEDQAPAAEAAAGPAQIWPTPDRLSPYYGATECNVLWTYNSGRSLKPYISIGADDTVYVGGHKLLMALNRDGSLKWSFPTGGSIKNWPAIAQDGTVYFTSTDGVVRALTSDGKLKWKFVNEGKYSSSAVLGSDGTVYFGNESGHFYALRADGSIKWKYEVGGLINHPTIGKDGTIYFGSWNRNVYALSPNGSLKWKFATDGKGTGAPAVAKDGSIYIGMSDGYLYALTAEGDYRWRYRTGATIKTGPAIGPSGSIVFGSYDNYIYALNSDGTLAWCYATGHDLYPGAAIGADGTVYFGSHDGILYVFNPDGTLIWSFDTNSQVQCVPAIGRDGTVYIGALNGTIYAFGHRPTAPPESATGNTIGTFN
jgi:outer membrane protein assembly factor BamB